MQTPNGAGFNSLPSIREFHPTFREEPSADVEMTDSESRSPTFTDMTQQPSASPALHGQDARPRQHSYSSLSTDQRHYSFSTSANTSPAFGPRQHGLGYVPSNASVSGSTLTSPALGPQNDLDQEATTALLMLNTDRRGLNKDGRGLSVRDLLST